jgi:L-methionine (R)-S-oxide reductase
VERLFSWLKAFIFQVSNLANTSSIIFNALFAFAAHFGSGEKAVNWCGG